jgi:predicted AAA+ superfamily ATPase
MLDRRLTAIVKQRLAQFPAVALLGPGQVGKTTLAKKVRVNTESIYLDLENPQDLEKLEDPRGYLSRMKQLSASTILDKALDMNSMAQLVGWLED